MMRVLNVCSTGRGRRRRGPLARRGYLLLETVIATGVLIVGLAVIGAQVQDAVTTVRTMDERSRAMLLAEQHMAEIGLGLIKLDSADDEQEEEFGPRYPEFGWRLTIDDTAVDELFLLKLEILHFPREDFEDEFDFDLARVLHTVYTMRQNPKNPAIPLSTIATAGGSQSSSEGGDDPLEEIDCECFDDLEFDLSCLLQLEIVDIIALGECLQDLNIDPSGLGLPQIEIPPGVMALLEEYGLGDALEDAGDATPEGR